jgi:hypothetical protein
MDPRELAEDILDGILPAPKTRTDSILLSIAYGIIGLCERLDGLSCIVAIPQADEDEDEDEEGE